MFITTTMAPQSARHPGASTGVEAVAERPPIIIGEWAKEEYVFSRVI